MTTTLLNQMLMMFLLAAVGYACRRSGLTDEKIQSGISRLVIQVSIPAVILSSADKPYDPAMLPIVGMVFLGGILYHAAALFLGARIAKALRLPQGQGIIFQMLVSFTNVAFIGYPIIAIFLPETGTFYATFFVVTFNVIFYTYGMLRISGETRVSLRSLFGNLPTLASFLMLTLYLLQIRLPLPLRQTLASLGSLSTPLSMLVVGGMLAGVPLRSLLTTPLLYLASLVRLVVFPLIAFAVLKALSLPVEAATVILVMCALPSGATTALAAQIHGTEPSFASKGVLQSNLFFLLTIFLTVFLVGKL